MEDDGESELREPAAVGRYRRRRDAEEHGLVVLAMGRDYCVFREDGEFVLCVEARDREAVLHELEKYESERGWARWYDHLQVAGKNSKVSLYVFAWVMAAFFLAQQIAPPWWMERGEASSVAMVRGQWWRALTALTLHSGVPHLLANLATGLIFAAFLTSMVGTGLAWLAIVLSGALGNAINAWFYRGEAHVAIGASTAVFGALGVLVGCQVVARVLSLKRFGMWEMIVPVGAGLGLLAYLGTGDERTDYMAHFWGFAAGGALGAIMTAFRLGERTPAVAQRVLAGLALLIVAAAWLFAWKG